MSFGKIYTEFVNASVTLDPDTKRERLGLSFGALTEAGEAWDHLKKVMYHGKDFEDVRTAFMLEFGDMLWYVTLMCHTLDVEFGEALALNILKLTDRFPEKYGDDLAYYRKVAQDYLDNRGKGAVDILRSELMNFGIDDLDDAELEGILDALNDA